MRPARFLSAAVAAAPSGPKLRSVHVAELWRYPVKSLAGERLEAVDVGPDGFPGDRVMRVEDPSGKPITARTKPELLGLRASVNGDARFPLVDGRPWDSAAVGAAVAGAAGDGARLVPAPAGQRVFDESPLLVATDGAIEALGYDGRRFRPNIVVAGVSGMAEREWDGRRLRIGAAQIDLGHLCERCVLTTFQPDTREQDPDVLRRVNAELGGLFARNCWVVAPGRIAVGDAVELL